MENLEVYHKKILGSKFELHEVSLKLLPFKVFHYIAIGVIQENLVIKLPTKPT
jgi:hypothetical protein